MPSPRSGGLRFDRASIDAFISSGLNLALGLMFDKGMFLWFTSRTEAEVAPCGFNKASIDLEQERDFKGWLFLG